jgi:hypothetical protein
VVARPKSGLGGRPAKNSPRPAPENTLVNRLADSARYRASLDYGYRVTGLKAFDTVTPSRGVAWFSLTRGSLIITADGEETTAEYQPTYALAEPAYKEAVQRARAAA